MYIFLYPDGTIDVRDTWDIDYKPPIGTLVYEPSDPVIPWTIQRENGPVSLMQLSPECRAVELLYPRSTASGSVSKSLKKHFSG